ncbi:conserved domain protein [Trichinella spiralis]|uniref:hypothetical protein n=1 Tax=Trichinella spiralis TaxID=6334 RepID=UPI0001EFB841|nr:conserved domain protein [Trichinella spiralis]
MITGNHTLLIIFYAVLLDECLCLVLTKILRSDDEEGGRGGGGGGGGVIQDDGEKESCAGAYTMSFLVCFTCCCRLVYCKVDRSVGRSVVSLFLCYLLIKVCYLTLCIASCIASAGKGKCCSNI